VTVLAWFEGKMVKVVAVAIGKLKMTGECKMFYHGTSLHSGKQIQELGFDVALSGSQTGMLMGKGAIDTK
tara:strand:- start:1619 stop:1828 length:210 start_codon:yes stop_codon:yes gene_type:complete